MPDYVPVRALKYHPHNSVLFITFTIEEGLFLLSNPLCQMMIRSCLATAQSKYPIKICHFIVQATHVHMIVVVEDPQDVARFIGFFKTESAHMINRLLGRKKRTIWCEGYDSPVVLTPIRAAVAIAYLYGNPAKDNMVESIRNFPGLSSWSMLEEERGEHTWPRVRRSDFTAIPQGQNHSDLYSQRALQISSQCKEHSTFVITPNAWLDAFGIKDPLQRQRWNRRVLRRLATIEKTAAATRKAARREAIGRKRLLREVLRPDYRPQRQGKKSRCITENRPLRRRFLSFLKRLFAEARRVRDLWRQGDFTQHFPPGLYPPNIPRLAEAVAAW